MRLNVESEEDMMGYERGDILSGRNYKKTMKHEWLVFRGGDKELGRR